MRKKNHWKWLFLSLMGINGLIVIGVAILLLGPGTQQTERPAEKIDSKSYSEFTINTDKKDLNALINHYIEKEGLNGPVDYNVYLQDEVELKGEIQVFSQTLDLYMKLEPKAQKNGDLILEQKSISLGNMKLPVSFVMKFIADTYKLPSWVTIDPKEQEVYVALHEMTLNNGIKVAAKEFDLENDRISFIMKVPNE